MGWGDLAEAYILEDLEDWAGPQECRISLCKDRWNCANQQTCDIYAQAWTLPYYYDLEGKCLYVCMGQAFGEIKREGFEDIVPDLIKEWHMIGFEMAQSLQWERKPGGLIVRWDVGEFRRAERIPYQYNYSVPSLIVWEFLSEDAKKAGYAPAVGIENCDDLPW